MNGGANGEGGKAIETFMSFLFMGCSWNQLSTDNILSIRDGEDKGPAGSVELIPFFGVIATPRDDSE